MSNPDNEGNAVLKELSVETEAAGTRLDQWLAVQFAPEMSRNRIQGLIRDGQVQIDDAVITEPRRKLKSGERVSIIVPDLEPIAPQPENIPLAILYEDDELIVINKPAGLVVHPGAGNPTGTLVNALIGHCGGALSAIGGIERAGIVHRLDKDTSGVIVVAKTDHAHRGLTEQFADHGRSGDLERAYDALVWGTPARMTGTVDAPLGRAADRMRRAVAPADRADARHAVTHFTVNERFGERFGERFAPTGRASPGRGVDGEAMASLLECRLETGRTHQIRVHLAHIGHPVIGDQDYGRAFVTKANRLAPRLKDMVRAFPRQALHARLLAFRHPTSGELMRFEAPWPEDFMELIDGFRHWVD